MKNEGVHTCAFEFLQLQMTVQVVICARFEVIDVLGRCFMKNEGVRTRALTEPCLPVGAATVPPPTAELWAKVTVRGLPRFLICSYVMDCNISLLAGTATVPPLTA